MRSGQYKLSSKGGGELGKRESITSCTSYKELPSFPSLTQEEQQQPLPTNFINLDSLHLSVLKRVDEKDEDKDGAGKKYKEHIYKGNRKRDSILRHKSCENVSVLTRGTVNRVEQKVRSLLRVDSKWGSDNMATLPGELSDDTSKVDFWQAGKIVTMTKKPRLVNAHSHSALHTLSTSSDNASCLSASSGYSSSSSSSSYGSFKSSESVCSSLPRHRNNSSGSQSPIADNNRMLFADNPLYDIVPITSPQIVEPFFSLENSPYETFSPNEFLTEESTLISTTPITDPIAKQCIEYFEKRLSSSETLRKKWSLFINEPSERYSQINSDLISKGDAIIDSKFNAGFDSDMNLGVESNFSLCEEFTEGKEQKRKKNKLDEKMEILRHEIASLILQDNNLFKQLLSLHESISNLKVQTALNSSHSAYDDCANNMIGGGLSLGSRTPSDLESFTEEEELEGQIQSVSRIDFFTNECSSHHQFEDKLSLQTEEESFTFCEDKPSDTMNDDEDDEGHGTDLSLGDTPSNSSSPASTLSSNSSEGISYSRNLFSEMTSDHSGSFIRCRKSYAPNARNRRRSSSVNRQKSPSMECGTTTALVVIYADDEDLLLNSSRPRSHSFTPLTTFALHDALSYTEGRNADSKTNGNERTGETRQLYQATNNNTEGSNATIVSSTPSKITLVSCSSETDTSSTISIQSRPNHSHPPYREALIM